jgi:hypothetical protein
MMKDWTYKFRLEANGSDYKRWLRKNWLHPTHHEYAERLADF